jgi:hypothetical protein
MVVSGLQSFVNPSKTFLYRFPLIDYISQSPLFCSKWLLLMVAEQLGLLERRRLLVHSISRLRGMKVRSNVRFYFAFLFLRTVVICAILGSQFLYIFMSPITRRPYPYYSNPGGCSRFVFRTVAPSQLLYLHNSPLILG